MNTCKHCSYKIPRMLVVIDNEEKYIAPKYCSNCSNELNK